MDTNTICQTCACKPGLDNTGFGCSVIMRDAWGLILVPTYDNDGNRNGITLADGPFDQTFFDDLVNEPDKSKRFYPIASSDGIKDVVSEREKPVMKSRTDGSDEFIRQGKKPFVGYLTGLVATPVYAGKLESVRCLKGVSVYKIDRGGNLIGSLNSDKTILYPVQIDSPSFYAMFVEATPDKNNAEIEVSFNFSLIEQDKSLNMIACSEFTDYSLFQIAGLVDVCPTFSNLSEEGITIELTTDYGTPLNPTPDEGLLAADFSFFNVTQNSAIAITGSGSSFTESAPGVYDIEFATADQPTIGDEIRVTPSKNGRDYTCVVEDTYVVATT